MRARRVKHLMLGLWILLVVVGIAVGVVVGHGSVVAGGVGALVGVIVYTVINLIFLAFAFRLKVKKEAPDDGM
jgi:F0F1-type ATP synthase assembly protein I